MDKLSQAFRGWTIPGWIMFLYGAIDFLSNVEFVSNYINPVTNFLTSTRGNTLLIVGGIIWIVVVLYRQNHKLLERTNNIPKSLPSSPAPIPINIPSVKAPSGEQIDVPDNITPDYLAGFYEHHTKMQADRLMETYTRKGITVSGPIFDIRESHKHVQVSIGRSTSNKTLIVMRFDMNWKNRLSVLTKNTIVTVRGRIESAGLHQLNLHHCELLETQKR